MTHYEGIEKPRSPTFNPNPCFFIFLSICPEIIWMVPFEWIEVDLPKGEHKKPEFIANNPFGQVPTIDDDGFVMYESRAIARYLDEKYPNQGTQLFPKDLQRRALVDQATWAELFHFYRHGVRILFEVLNKRFFGLEANLTAVEEAKKDLLAKMDIYEGILSKQKYLTGDELTLADIVHIPVASRLVEEADVDLGGGRPNVQRWLNELVSRESWQKVKPIFRNGS
ncbi:hypothetical protein D9756_008514 [Leucocoprinus leucothites]|uniref:glutathione transferase n=1 Tax=Leucocoprinus leucothites TaxID=201217 RepID=A0A8H5CYX5_9AGAR|nr:hypothetical protein D9756_008514 [Leucoagaricus leucothites]